MIEIKCSKAQFNRIIDALMRSGINADGKCVLGKNEFTCHYTNKNTSKDFKRGFDYCRDRLVKTLEYIKEKEWYTDTADVGEVKHGRWKRVRYVECNDPNGGYWIVRCNQCSIPHIKEYRYCPSCGAKMDGRGDKQ